MQSAVKGHNISLDFFYTLIYTLVILLWRYFVLDHSRRVYHIVRAAADRDSPESTEETAEQEWPKKC